MADKDEWVILITGRKALLGGVPEPWHMAAFLVTYDPDVDHHGAVSWLQDAAKAKRYPSKQSAMADYERASIRHPLRDDGKANRPLFDRHTVKFLRLAEALKHNGNDAA